MDLEIFKCGGGGERVDLHGVRGWEQCKCRLTRRELTHIGGIGLFGTCPALDCNHPVSIHPDGITTTTPLLPPPTSSTANIQPSSPYSSNKKCAATAGGGDNRVLGTPLDQALSWGSGSLYKQNKTKKLESLPSSAKNSPAAPDSTKQPEKKSRYNNTTPLPAPPTNTILTNQSSVSVGVKVVPGAFPRFDDDPPPAVAEGGDAEAEQREQEYKTQPTQLVPDAVAPAADMVPAENDERIKDFIEGPFSVSSSSSPSSSPLLFMSSSNSIGNGGSGSAAGAKINSKHKNKSQQQQPQLLHTHPLPFMDKDVLQPFTDDSKWKVLLAGLFKAETSAITSVDSESFLGVSLRIDKDYERISSEVFDVLRNWVDAQSTTTGSCILHQKNMSMLRHQNEKDFQAVLGMVTTQKEVKLKNSSPNKANILQFALAMKETAELWCNASSNSTCRCASHSTVVNNFFSQSHH